MVSKKLFKSEDLKQLLSKSEGILPVETELSPKETDNFFSTFATFHLPPLERMERVSLTLVHKGMLAV